MSNDRLDSIDKKLDSLLVAFADYRVKSEGRITKLETVQSTFSRMAWAVMGTVIASFSSVVAYLARGGE